MQTILLMSNCLRQMWIQQVIDYSPIIGAVAHRMQHMGMGY